MMVNRMVLLLATAMLLAACSDDCSSTGGPAPSSAVNAPAPSMAVNLPTSEWTPGLGGDGARIAGELSVDENNCVYLANGPTRTWVLWPKGYRATISSDGVLTLFDAEGSVVAHDGDEVEMGGGYGWQLPIPAGEECIPDRGGLGYVQSDVTVIRE